MRQTNKQSRTGFLAVAGTSIAMAMTAASAFADDLPLPSVPAARPAVAAVTPAVAPVLIPGKSVVFPFDPVGQTVGQEWVGSAIQQSLITDAAQVPGIQSGALTSAAHTDADLLTAAKSASAQYLVSGSFQVVENQVKITGRIVDTTTGKTIGTLKTAGTFKDLFALEDNLGTQVHKTLATLHVGSQTPRADQLNTVDAVRFGNQTPPSTGGAGLPAPTDAQTQAAYNRYNFGSAPYYPYYGYYGYYGGYYPYAYGYGYGFYGFPYGPLIIVTNAPIVDHRRHHDDSHSIANNPPVLAPPIRIKPPVRDVPYQAGANSAYAGARPPAVGGATYVGPSYNGPSGVVHGSNTAQPISPNYQDASALSH